MKKLTKNKLLLSTMLVTSILSFIPNASAYSIHGPSGPLNELSGLVINTSSKIFDGTYPAKQGLLKILRGISNNPTLLREIQTIDRAITKEDVQEAARVLTLHNSSSFNKDHFYMLADDIIYNLRDFLTRTRALKNSPSIVSEIKKQVSSIQNSNETDKDTKIAKLRNTLENFVIDTNNLKDLKGLTQLQATDSAVTESMVNASLAISNVIADRIAGTSSGIASGDDSNNYGAWIKGTFTSGKQKEYKLIPGYKFNQKGVTIGADMGEDSMIGVAYSYFSNDIKNKTNIANKEDITSHVGTLYGLYAINQNLFVSGQGQYGFNKIKKTRATTSSTTSNFATANPKGNILAARAIVGYNYNVAADVTLTPTAGISHTDATVKAYKEKGDSLNRSIGKRSATRTSAIAGISAKYSADIGNDLTIVPEIHANIDYAFSRKNSDTKITIIDGIDPLVTPAQKLTQTYFNVGTSLKVLQAKSFDATLGYDLGIAKKFASHTGSLKLKVNF